MLLPAREGGQKGTHGRVEKDHFRQLVVHAVGSVGELGSGWILSLGLPAVSQVVERNCPVLGCGENFSSWGFSASALLTRQFFVTGLSCALWAV